MTSQESLNPCGNDWEHCEKYKDKCTNTLCKSMSIEEVDTGLFEYLSKWKDCVNGQKKEMD